MQTNKMKSSDSTYGSSLNSTWLIALFALFINVMYVLPGMLTAGSEFIFFVWILFKGHFQIRKNFVWYASFCLLFLLLTILRDSNPFGGYFSSSVHCLLIVFLASNIIRNKEDIATFIKAYALAGIPVCLYLAPSLLSLFYLDASRYVGVSGNGFLDSAISLGHALMFISICQLWAINHFERNIVKLICTAAFVFTIILIVLTGTRKALFAPILFLLLTTYYKKGKSFATLLKYSVVFLVFTGCLWYIIMHNEVLYHLMGERILGGLGLFSDVEIDESSQERQELARGALELVRDRWLFGVGCDSMLYALGKHAHNNYLSLLCIGGIGLVISYYFVPVRRLFSIMRNKRKDEIDVFSICIISCILFVDFMASTFNLSQFIVFLSIVTIGEKEFFGAGSPYEDRKGVFLQTKCM